jgi:hypothetical protein
MVEQNQISHFHFVPHEIASLVISNPVPTGDHVTIKIVDRIGSGLTFHQPVFFCRRHVTFLSILHRTVIGAETALCRAFVLEPGKLPAKWIRHHLPACDNQTATIAVQSATTIAEDLV